LIHFSKKSCHQIKINGNFDIVCSRVTYLYKDTFVTKCILIFCSPNLWVLFAVTFAGGVGLFAIWCYC